MGANRKRSVCFWHKAGMHTDSVFAGAQRRIAIVWRAITGLVRVSPLRQIIDQWADDTNAGAKAMFSMESFAGDRKGQFLFRQ
jgi:hypothetical protein